MFSFFQLKVKFKISKWGVATSFWVHTNKYNIERIKKKKGREEREGEAIY